MKVRLLFYDLHQTAGIQKALIYWVNNFSRHAESVELILAKNTPEKIGPLPGNVDVKYLFAEFPDSHSIIRGIRYAFRYFRKYSQVENDLITIDFGTYVWIFSKQILCYKHFGLKGNKRHRLFFRLIKIIFGQRSLIVLSNQIKKDFEALGYQDVAVLPNFISEDEYEELLSIRRFYEESKKNNTERLVMAGRGSKQKGFDIAIESFVPVGNLKLVLYSDSSFFSQYKNFDSFVFFNRFANPLELFGATTAILMPSRYEGLPFLAVEALLVGVPVFHSGADGFNEIFGDCDADFFELDFYCDKWSEILLWRLSDPSIDDRLKRIQNRLHEKFVKFSRSAFIEMSKVINERQ